MKIMILYASYGDGHLQAARAISEAIVDRGLGEPLLVDLLAEAHPWINAVTRRVYMRSYSLIPGLYGWLYDRTKPMKHDSVFAIWLHSFGRGRLRRILERERPDAVIHTFPLLAMPALKKRTGLRIPTCTVVTDFDLHRRWVHPDIDRYYVPTEDMKKELHALGISGRRICVSGIPIRRGFRSASVDPEQCARFGFRIGSPVVLVMAGAQATVSGVSAMISPLFGYPDLTVAVVCGRNAALASSLPEQFGEAGAEGRLRVFGYVEAMHELMAQAACIVTKSGGVTLAESLSLDLPIFVYRPVPGQERNNARFLEGKGAARITETPEQLTQEIVQLLHDPVLRMQHAIRARKFRFRDSAVTVALDFCTGLPITRRTSVRQS
ncbi:MGDG synthase family glycosyltransferase [Paenibacillus sacheonensis]|uniref:Diacylglycerol glucosyltransferase n=1 Tax=Paenibacillus sacheonensis TaxID=742054 RepID=A0A7X4YUG8_9BACL|nr:glycosyltransferase [Paenibacillus sacheonensis]MBM7568953.1 processive 1,2-diacylglycerol beta-glucosyltransferase [Paenibacillus sacheonensis]NBC72673.1 diacylglycerol glucosyltransferase [Paenibacillus sacheonensis]